jgi:hypothetical protein
MAIGSCTCCLKEFKYNTGCHTGKFCSIGCQHRYQKEQRIDEWLAGRRKYPGKAALREYMTKTHGYKCACCGINEWNKLPISLEIDHIDGDPYNDNPSNLRFICPNCHSQTPTYKGKNKGKGRVCRAERAIKDYYRQNTMNHINILSA